MSSCPSTPPSHALTCTLTSNHACLCSNSCMARPSCPSSSSCTAHGHPCALCHATWASRRIIGDTPHVHSRILSLPGTPISGMKPTCVNVLSFLIRIVQKSQDTRATQQMQRRFRRRGRPSLAPDSTPHPSEAIGLIGARTHEGHIITAGKYGMTNRNPRRITRWGAVQTNGRGVLGTCEGPAGPQGARPRLFTNSQTNHKRKSRTLKYRKPYTVKRRRKKK